jgi:hypothetical protein
MDEANLPSGIVESTGTRGEDLAKDNHEPGRVDLPDHGGRPAGGTTARFATGVGPQDPVDPKSPNLIPG